MKDFKIAIIGGGVAGSSSALYLGNFGLNITLFEKNKSLVDGPPMCHLHAGGNLYREISDEQCIRLLKESIEFVRFYPQSIDFRPTVIITPLTDKEEPESILPRLKKLQLEYKKLIEEDKDNEVLGDYKDYFKLYYENDIIKLQNKETPKTPCDLDDWLIPVVKNIDLSKIKFPIILVQEYGLNVFRIGASATILLNKLDNVTLNLETEITNVIKKDNYYEVEYFKNGKKFIEKFDFLINSAGFRSGKIDDSLKFKRDRFVEFKAAYVTKWENKEKYWPEIIFHGERGTPNGMAQFTPYNGGYFQLHGMTKDITLFEDGLVKSESNSSQPELDNKFINRIDKNWEWEVVEDRTKKAINHLAKFLPSFKTAVTASKPLYGAQQIPGNDETLRAAEISFEGCNYGRCEIVKASSIFAMSDELMKKLIDLGIVDKKLYRKRDFSNFIVEKSEVDEVAQNFAEMRGYPRELGKIIFERREKCVQS